MKIDLMNLVLFEITEREVVVLYFATAAHAAVKQVRKYTGEPYIVHPIDVANTLVFSSKDVVKTEVIQAAFLHDVVEDTGITNETIRSLFGDQVADLVAEVTDVSKPEDGNRKTRKELDRQHLAKASRDGQNIKLADLISNTKSIAKYDPHFAKVYLKEKEALLEVLTKGDSYLYSLARANIV